MADQNVYDENWDDVEDEVKEASKGTGVYVDLVDDGDEAFIAFIQKPQTRKVMSDKYGLKNKTRVNVAMFNEAFQFIGIGILSLAPTKFADVLDDRREYGGNKIYKIRRRGARDYPQTAYRLTPQRDLTEDEKANIAQHQLHELWEDAATTDDSPPPAPAPTPAAPPQGDHAPEALDHELFVAAVKVEMEKRKWGPGDYEIANKKFFGSHYQKFPDLDPVERQDILTAIRVLPNDAQATDIAYRGELGDDLDLESDVDFF